MAAVAAVDSNFSQFLSKQPHMLCGPRRCPQSGGAGERVWNAAVYVELRRLTNDAHQALNGHNKLLYLLYLSLSLAVSVSASGAAASAAATLIVASATVRIDTESRFEEYAQVNEN